MTTGTKPKGSLRQLVSAAFGDAVRPNCREQGCRLCLTGISNCVVLKGEAVVKDKKMCDCIVIHAAHPPRTALVELKSGNVKHNQVAEKFSNALDLVPRAEQVAFGSEKCRLSLLLLVKHRQHRSFYALWRRQKFKIRGAPYTVRVLPCGTELADAYKMR